MPGEQRSGNVLYTASSFKNIPWGMKPNEGIAIGARACGGLKPRGMLYVKAIDTAEAAAAECLPAGHSDRRGTPVRPWSFQQQLRAYHNLAARDKEPHRNRANPRLLMA